MSEITMESDVETRRELRERLGRDGLKIAQPDEPPLFTRSPESPMVPMHWRWADLHAYLEELGRVLNLEPGGDRRTLRLANPGLEYGTTPTFWASIQYINPGEVATAHRHTPDAFRFIMHGNGCTTNVEGEKYDMNEGDLVLTPNWMWHDHVHEGAEPMIWLDVLDVSVMKKLHNIYFDPYEKGTQPVNEYPETSYREFGSGLMRPVGPAPRQDRNPLLVYTKAQSDAAMELAKGLRPDPLNDVILEYQNPAGGGSALPSMSMKMQIIRPGFQGKAHRHSGSKVYHVLEGSGTTIVNGRRFEWNKGDFMSIPPWATHRHLNEGASEARLFRVDDSPILRYLNAYHEEVLEDASEAEMLR
ncbi:cupin domain-containing protein [Arthrobacter sp. ISL-72]|uniref:cupin domain-containing protein n=1 Tax=Arthrobacter sp. ISL-72 TaxID=2819114 RepID=UPI001BE881B6|nr:cupin domain-containing protein [Arthrobacter sp. ISL-72]MBT2597877.1 cupin domain-containing protein [Arthrobacter sp. ISL-72]